MSDTQREQALKLVARRLDSGSFMYLSQVEVDTVCQELRASEAENSAMRKHTQAFLDKVTEVGKAVDGVIGVQTARGYPYTGPNWGVEHAALTAALAGTPAQPCTACADLKRTVELVCIGRDAAISTCAELKTLLEEKEKFIDASEAEFTEKQGEIERLREVLKQHHSWHLEIGTVMVSTPPNPYGNDDLVELDLTEAYSESGLCEETTAALSGSPASTTIEKVDQQQSRKYPILVACAIIVRDGKVLLERHAPNPPEYKTHQWDIPGGKVEIGESSRDAVIREIREEMGITIDPLRMIPELYDSVWTDPDGARQWVLACYECSIVEGNPALTDDLQWHDLVSLDASAIKYPDFAILKSLVSGSPTDPPKKARIVYGTVDGVLIDPYAPVEPERSEPKCHTCDDTGMMCPHSIKHGNLECTAKIPCLACDCAAPGTADQTGK